MHLNDIKNNNKKNGGNCTPLLFNEETSVKLASIAHGVLSVVTKTGFW